ncbi:hypothetical protein [Luteimonas gilva]|nr:hypothetical protein [Luteimonas gilva]
MPRLWPFVWTIGADSASHCPDVLGARPFVRASAGVDAQDAATDQETT